VSTVSTPLLLPAVYSRDTCNDGTSPSVPSASALTTTSLSHDLLYGRVLLPLTASEMTTLYREGRYTLLVTTSLLCASETLSYSDHSPVDSVAAGQRKTATQTQLSPTGAPTYDCRAAFCTGNTLLDANTATATAHCAIDFVVMFAGERPMLCTRHDSSCRSREVDFPIDHSVVVGIFVRLFIWKSIK